MLISNYRLQTTPATYEGLPLGSEAVDHHALYHVQVLRLLLHKNDRLKVQTTRYPKHYEVESTLNVEFPSLDVYGVQHSEWVGGAHHVADLPVDVPVYVEDVEEHVGVGEEGRHRQRGEALPVQDPEVCSKLEGHVKHVHLRKSLSDTQCSMIMIDLVPTDPIG